jgi:hypothetical protein
LTGIDGTTDVTAIRIPYRKIATQALNNDKSALQFVVSTFSTVGGRTMSAVTFNANTGAIVADVDITPSFGGTTYTPRLDHSISLSGANSQNIVALCLDISSPTPPQDLLVSDDGGGTWSRPQTGVAYRHVLHVDGSEDVIFLGGSESASAAEVALSLDNGTTLLDQTGDIGVNGLFGVIGFPE